MARVAAVIDDCGGPVIDFKELVRVAPIETDSLREIPAGTFQGVTVVTASMWFRSPFKRRV